MDEAEAVQKLNAIIVAQLFGDGTWPADTKTADDLHATLEQLGVYEPVPGQPDTHTTQSRGTGLNICLMMIFMGIWDEVEVPCMLEQYGLIDDLEFNRLYDELETGADPVPLLLPVVRRAYFQHFNPSGLVS